MQLQSIFKKEKNIIIGAVHLPPLLGFKDFPGFKTAIKNILSDIRACEKGGVDAIIFENNYDNPHTINVDPEIIAAMTFIGEKIRHATKLPIGISVLWNDYRTALAIAKTLDLQFIRIPVFVDDVETSYGKVFGEAKKVIAYRKKIKAEHIALFTDIHVKHAKLLSKHSLIESAKLAKQHGSDAVIITGKWTGDAPVTTDIETIRNNLKHFPILLGSGVSAENAINLLRHANGAIVSTSLKSGTNKPHEVNVKSYEQRINRSKVKKLTQSLKAGNK